MHVQYATWQLKKHTFIYADSTRAQHARLVYNAKIYAYMHAYIHTCLYLSIGCDVWRQHRDLARRDTSQTPDATEDFINLCVHTRIDIHWNLYTSIFAWRAQIHSLSDGVCPSHTCHWIFHQRVCTHAHRYPGVSLRKHIFMACTHTQRAYSCVSFTHTIHADAHLHGTLVRIWVLELITLGMGWTW